MDVSSLRREDAVKCKNKLIEEGILASNYEELEKEALGGFGLEKGTLPSRTMTHIEWVLGDFVRHFEEAIALRPVDFERLHSILNIMNQGYLNINHFGLAKSEKLFKDLIETMKAKDVENCITVFGAIKSYYIGAKKEVGTYISYLSLIVTADKIASPSSTTTPDSKIPIGGTLTKSNSPPEEFL